MTLRVQIVARDQGFRDRLQLALERIDVDGEEPELVMAANGNEALALAAVRPPDLVVVEIGVRPYGGFGLTRDLKGLPELSCPVIVILERRQDDWLGRWCGADAMVSRPVDPFALAETATQLLRARRGGAASPAPAPGVAEAGSAEPAAVAQQAEAGAGRVAGPR